MEHIMRLSVTELQVVRVTCLMCRKAAIEVKLDQLHEVLSTTLQCRFCGHTHYRGQPQDSPLVRLQQVLQGFQAVQRIHGQQELAVEFLIPAPPTP